MNDIQLTTLRVLMNGADWVTEMVTQTIGKTICSARKLGENHYVRSRKTPSDCPRTTRVAA